LIPVKRESKSLIAFVVAAVLNIGLNFVLIPILSEKGAAITTVLAEFSAMAINLYYGRDVIVPVIRNFSSTYNMITVIIASIGIIATCLIVNAFALALIIRLVLQVILSGLVYVVLLLIMGNETIKDVLIKMREGIAHI
jgi:O-antigen/teichoic acid export membrane protein